MSDQLPRAVLLDLDDTILDDTGDTVQCWLDACVAHQSAMRELDPVVLHNAIESARAWYWADPERHRLGRLDLGAARADVVQLALDGLGVDVPGLAVTIAETHSRDRDRLIQPFADAVDTVRWLRERGCRLALLTNGSSAAQRAKINRFDLESLFDLILIEGELGFGKPDRRVYQRALDGLDVEPSDAWMAGDNLEWDVAEPQRLGIFGIWVDVQGTGLRPGHDVRPDRIVHRLSELRRPNGRA